MAITYWILTVVSAVAVAICLVLLLAVQSDSLTELACGLGSSDACQHIQIVGLVRDIAVIGAIGGALFMALFAALGLWETFH